MSHSLQSSAKAHLNQKKSDLSISENLKISGLSFDGFDLDPLLLQALQAEKFQTPTEIQVRVIPIIKSGQDLMASAETGAGKTVAFVLPTLQRLISTDAGTGKGPRALVLTPTRELADQVTETIRRLAKFTRLKVGAVTGGLPYPAQERMLRNSIDILVATPGRLMDHMNRGRVDFSRLSIFILDEADRMLDMGFINDIETIIEPIPEDRQVLLFSATLEGAVQGIAKRILRQPACVKLALDKPPALIAQRLHAADDLTHKRALLTRVLEEPGMWQAIVFTGTKRSAEELATTLAQKNIICSALHGDMKQSKRRQTLDRMRSGNLRVLIATDVAARGLDVKTISHVINFDMPRTVEDYIHRIGRTGRAGESGVAVSFVGPKEWSQISQIERVTGQKLERQLLAGLEPRKQMEAPGNRNNRNGRGQSRGRSTGNATRNSNGRDSDSRYSNGRNANGRDSDSRYSNGKNSNGRNANARNSTRNKLDTGNNNKRRFSERSEDLSRNRNSNFKSGSKSKFNGDFKSGAKNKFNGDFKNKSSGEFKEDFLKKGKFNSNSKNKFNNFNNDSSNKFNRDFKSPSKNKMNKKPGDFSKGERFARADNKPRADNKHRIDDRNSPKNVSYGQSSSKTRKRREETRKFSASRSTASKDRHFYK